MTSGFVCVKKLDLYRIDLALKPLLHCALHKFCQDEPRHRPVEPSKHLILSPVQVTDQPLVKSVLLTKEVSNKNRVAFHETFSSAFGCSYSCN